MGKKSLSSFSRSQRTPKFMRYWKQAPMSHLGQVAVPKQQSFSSLQGEWKSLLHCLAQPAQGKKNWGKNAKPGW